MLILLTDGALTAPGVATVGSDTVGAMKWSTCYPGGRLEDSAVDVPGVDFCGCLS